ncbi:unnamed protein product [marine sediment metagenome]|uniref:Uncharacterized protein n=1 Tax=marine sediment metagenome TaxID=412755 RepID=X1TTY8_9ZZZZ
MAENIKKRSKESYLAKTVKGRRRQAKGRKQRWPGNSKSRKRDLSTGEK